MNFFSNIFQRTTINEKVLKQNHIPILSYNELSYDKKNLFAVTLCGKFYKGFYKKTVVSIKVKIVFKIKVIEIKDNDDLLLSEFLTWQEKKTKPYFLQLEGVIMTNQEAIIIFDSVTCTLEQALQKGLLKNPQKFNIAGELLNLIDILQSKNKIIRDLRPGMLAINGNFQLKLLDFGKFSFNNQDLL